jgi:hypothetical protein
MTTAVRAQLIHNIYKLKKSIENITSSISLAEIATENSAVVDIW